MGLFDGLKYEIYRICEKAQKKPLKTAIKAVSVVAAPVIIPGMIVKKGVKLLDLSLSNKIIKETGECLVDNLIRDKVTPVPGSVVYCGLALNMAEHSGIYVGRGKIIHLNGDGIIESVNYKKFLKRLGGFNTALSIYVSCKNGRPVGSASVSKRAKMMVGDSRHYNVVLDNCHQFSAGCLSGDFDNSSNFLWMLKQDAENLIKATEWRVWDLS